MSPYMLYIILYTIIYYYIYILVYSILLYIIAILTLLCCNYLYMYLCVAISGYTPTYFNDVFDKQFGQIPTYQGAAAFAGKTIFLFLLYKLKIRCYAIINIIMLLWIME
jgi:hypothetical protein